MVLSPANQNNSPQTMSEGSKKTGTPTSLDAHFILSGGFVDVFN